MLKPMKYLLLVMHMKIAKICGAITRHPLFQDSENNCEKFS